MSTAFTSVFNSLPTQNATDPRLKFSSAPVLYNPYAPSSSSIQNAPIKPVPNPLAFLKKQTNSKRTPEEVEIIQQTVERFKERLAQDQAAVLYPDVDSPFVDEQDVVNRLLPYHIFQQPKEDLERLISPKGKEKADWKAEIRDTKFALECHKRRQKLVDRWRGVNVRSGQRAAPDDQAYYLAQVVLDADRSENAWVGNELRSARTEAERIEREKRAAASAMRMSQFPSTPQGMMPMQAQYYRAYPYAYTQAYGTTTPVSAPVPQVAPPPTISTFPATPAPAPAPAPVVPPTATTYSPYLPNGAIPVQLPVASLPALHALGIVPVPAASLPPEGQQQPAAVLRGSTANGTILSLEINVSLLQSTQMTGLAMVLNSLVARTQNAAAATANAAANSVSGPVKRIDSNI